MSAQGEALHMQAKEMVLAMVVSTNGLHEAMLKQLNNRNGPPKAHNGRDNERSAQGDALHKRAKEMVLAMVVSTNGLHEAMLN